MIYAGPIIAKEHRQRKPRKVFDKARERKKSSLFRYGNKYGEGQIKINQDRLEELEKKNRQNLSLYFLSFLLLSLCVASSVGYFLNQFSFKVAELSVPVKKSHASESLKKDMAMVFYRLGYQAWNQADYETAIYWFGKAESFNPEYEWSRNEYALYGLYKDACISKRMYCAEYQMYEELLMKTLLSTASDRIKKSFLRSIAIYNQEMFTFFKYDNIPSTLFDVAKNKKNTNLAFE